MPSYDSIIRNGTVVDGSGQIAPYKADLGIRNGKIAAIGGVRGDAKREIDATGCIVAPGFVEIHGHYDAQLRWDPYCTPRRLARRHHGQHRSLRLRLGAL